MTLRVHPDEIVAKSTSGILATHSSWERVRLDQIASVLNGCAFPSTGFGKSGDMPLIRIRDVGRGSTGTWYTGAFEPQYVVENGSLIVGMDGEFRVDTWRGPPSLLNQRVCKIEVRNPALYSERFLRWVLPGYLDAVNCATSSVTVKHLSSRTIKELPLPLPPIAEQKRIVAAIEEQFSRLDIGVASLQRARQGLAQLSRAVLWSAFPSSWPTRPLVELTDPLRPICYGILKPKTVGSLVIPYVEVRSIQNGRIEVDRLHRTTQELHDEFRRSELCVGDVVLAIRGSFDRAAVVPPELTGGNVSRDVARIAPKSMLHSAFLAYYLGGPHAAAFFSRAARGVGVRGVNIGDLRKMPVPVPSERQQQQTVARIEHTQSVIAAMTTEIDAALRRAQTLRSSILKQAFAGGLAYQDPADEPASTLLEAIVAKRDSSNGQKPTKARGQRLRKVTA